MLQTGDSLTTPNQKERAKPAKLLQRIKRSRQSIQNNLVKSSADILHTDIK